jgi:hypothetical protein
MARQGAFAALTLAAALAAPSCTGPAPRGAVGDLQVSTMLDITATVPWEGDLATVVFTIRNTTKNYVILRDLTYLADPGLKESASAAATWQFGQPGKLSYDPDGNEWAYDRSKKNDVTAAVFNSGLLAPTEALTVRTRIRLLNMPKYFQLLYFELPLDKIRSDVYFEARQDREIRYRALIGLDLAARLTPEPNPEAVKHRTVLYPFAERVQPNASIKPLKVESELRPRAFSLPDAVRKTGGSAVEQYTYCASLQAWILKRGAEFSLVTPAAVTPLPLLRQMDRTFYFIDHVGVDKIEIQLMDDQVASYLQLEKKYTVVPQKRPGEMKYFLFLQVLDLPRFFGDIRSSTMRMAIDVEMTPEGGGRLRVVH